MTVPLKDGLFWFFAVLAGLLLVVSLPATFAIVQPFHAHKADDWIFAALLLAVLELGAVGCKIGAHAAPRWGKRLHALVFLFLLLTSIGNYMAAEQAFAQWPATAMSPALVAVRTAGAGWLFCGVYAGIVPLLLLVFLSLALGRCTQREPLPAPAPPVVQIDMQVFAAPLQALADSVQALREDVRTMPALVPPQVQYPRPAAVGAPARKRTANVPQPAVCACGCGKPLSASDIKDRRTRKRNH